MQHPRNSTRTNKVIQKKSMGHDRVGVGVGESTFGVEIREDLPEDTGAK